MVEEGAGQVTDAGTGEGEGTEAAPVVDALFGAEETAEGEGDGEEVEAQGEGTEEPAEVEEKEAKKPNRAQTRIQELVKERKELTSKYEALESELEELKNNKDRNSMVVRAASELYKDFENPMKQIMVDHDISTVIGHLFQTGDTNKYTIQELVKQVEDFQRFGKLGDVTRKTLAEPQEETASGDPRVEKFFLAQSSAETREILGPGAGNFDVRPEIQKTIIENVLDNVDLSDGAPTREDLETLARDFIKSKIEDGTWTKEYIRGHKVEGENSNLPTGGARRNIVETKGTPKSKKKQEEEAPPKNLNEWRKRQNERIADLLGERAKDSLA